MWGRCGSPRLRRNDGGGGCLGCWFCGTPLGSGYWWSPGERFAACSVCAACSVGALWPVACQGRDTPGGSAAPARPLQGRPPRVRHGCDTGRVGLLRLSPHGVGQSSSFTRRADGAPSGFGTSQDRYATSLSCGSSTSPPLWVDACDGAMVLRCMPRTGWRRIEVSERVRACQMGSTAFCDRMTMACQE